MRTSVRIVAAMTALAAVLALSSCSAGGSTPSGAGSSSPPSTTSGSASVQLPTTPPTITGTIASIAQPPGSGVMITIKGETGSSLPEVVAIYDKATTKLVSKGKDGTLTTIQLGTLVAGQKVSAWLSSAMTQSLPPQSSAEFIEVLQ